jgi:hypothetical protein
MHLDLETSILEFLHICSFTAFDAGTSLSGLPMGVQIMLDTPNELAGSSRNSLPNIIHCNA